MPIQERNPGLTEPLKSDLLPQDEFFRDGVQLLAALYGLNAEGGGMRRFAWSADWPLIDTAFGSTALVTGTMTEANFAATANGGPYATFGGADLLQVFDSGWQEPTTYTYLVWAWCYASAFGATNRPIISKYDAPNNCSWELYWRQASATFSFLCNAVGPSVNDVVVNSAYAEAINTWYFVAGYLNPGTLMRIFVGASTDTVLTITSLVAGIPASCFNGPIPFVIGAEMALGAASAYWNGRIGVLGGRSNVPAASINGHVTRLFHITRRLYQ